MNKLKLILALVVLVAPFTAVTATTRKLLDNPKVTGTNVEATQQYKRYDTARDSVLLNDAQSEVMAGKTDSITETVANSKKAGQVDVSTRSSIAGNDLHGLIDDASSSADGNDDGAILNAAREAYGISQVAKYGNGLTMDASNRGALANVDTQREIQKHLDDPKAAADAGADIAYAASFKSSHQWTNGNSGD